ncbi:NB-ARC domains-containing protein [Artemisia annua]|uniref:NB-ARC domains-containing protein n=1 Tax=Artemisia annua TaxID=35608 RepID=A0A2U1NN83_ARTAN|nr:NB-ARC domains-containing protein [Artemisia annua]
MARVAYNCDNSLEYDCDNTFDTNGQLLRQVLHMDRNDHYGGESSSLMLNQCSVFVSLEALPSLKILKIKSCSDGVMRSLIHVASSVTNLSIYGISGLTDEVSKDVMDYLGAVEEISIEMCNEISCVWESEAGASIVLVNLRKLVVSFGDKLVSLGEKEKVHYSVNNHLTSLRMESLSKGLQHLTPTSRNLDLPKDETSIRHVVTFTFAFGNKWMPKSDRNDNQSFNELLKWETGYVCLGYYQRQQVQVLTYTSYWGGNQFHGLQGYIHEHAVPMYIHCDIKYPNILIDENFRANVNRLNFPFYQISLCSKNNLQLNERRKSKAHLFCDADWLTGDAHHVPYNIPLINSIMLDAKGTKMEETIRRLQEDNAQMRSRFEREKQVQLQRQVERQVQQRELEANAREQA